MNEKEILNDEGVEILEEVSGSNRNILGKVVIVGAVVALGVTAVLYIKKRREAKKSMELPRPMVIKEEMCSCEEPNEEIIEVEE